LATAKPFRRAFTTRPRSFRNQPNPDEQVIQRRSPVTDKQILIFAGIFGIQVGDIFPQKKVFQRSGRGVNHVKTAASNF
jgi:hypothetical protein